MLRSAVVALGASVLTLGLALGLAAAKPVPVPVDTSVPLKKKPPIQGIDPVWAKQLTPQVKTPGAPAVQPFEPPPNFAAIKRMTPLQKAVALKTPPERLTGPISLSARRPYHDDKHYLELASGRGTVALRTRQNYAFLGGSDEVHADIFGRPEALVYFESLPGRRYLLECAVDVSGTQAGTIWATDYGVTYSVNTLDRATLLFRHDGGAAPEQVTVRITGDRAWYLDGCELSWTGP